MGQAQISGFADQPPFLGDTTFNEAILYSPPLAPSNAAQPLFPNYTLSGTNLTMTPPSGLAALNVSLLLFNTSGAPASSVPRTACALRAAAKSVGQVINETFWLRDADGWRQEWLVGQLLPLTNYTAYAVVNETQVSQPLFFATKSGERPRPALDVGA
jgi:calcium channel MID1